MTCRKCDCCVDIPECLSFLHKASSELFTSSSYENHIHAYNFSQAPGQRYTDRDMNCGPRSITHLLSLKDGSSLWTEDKHDLFRKAVARHGMTLVELNEISWPGDESTEAWFARVSKTGLMVDHIWLCVCAKYLSTDICLIIKHY